MVDLSNHHDIYIKRPHVVVATAYAVIELPLPGDYRISVNYNLEIETKNKKVMNSTIDTGSFAMQKQ